MQSIGGYGATLTDAEIQGFITASLADADVDGKSVCVVVPDATRTCPLPLLLGAVHDAIAHRVSRLTVLVALGTHQPLREEALAAHVGPLPGATVVNHEWWLPDMLVDIGELSADQVREASGGRLAESVHITVNRHIVEHDVALVVGPVFPHEVVGFSGGNKYFFPGVAGSDIIDLTHWLGALITSSAIIGTPGVTPVRKLINEAAARLPCARHCIALVVPSGMRLPIYAAYGSTEEAWAGAAEVSARVHVRYLDAPVRRVLSLVSPRYDDLWTAAKGMYKVDPVVADGGEVVIYQPSIDQISVSHGEEIAKIGYHCRDYFLAEPARMAGVHRSVVAHSTHVRGDGSYDDDHGERCRIAVILATGISEAETRSVALDYRDPASIDIEEWTRDPDTLVVPDAGEVLFRLRKDGRTALG
ncbi:MAG: lactate racemase domain-containing protein [Mycobacteriales bacterium]